MKFKTENLKDEFWKCSVELRQILVEFEAYSVRLFGVEPTITCLSRVWDKKSPSVHAYIPCCGGDIRIQPKDTNIRPDYSDTQTKAMKYYINNMFFYGDNIHDTCVVHDTGSGLHFHLQTKPKASYKLNIEVVN